MGNVARALWAGLTGGHLLQVDGPAALRVHLQQLSRLSTAFALMGDFAMLFLGGDLKRREKISGRLADALSALYLGSCVAKRWHDDGEPVTDLPFVDWALQDCAHRAQEALFGVYGNFPVRWAGRLIRALSFPLGRSYAPPGDRLGHQISALLMQASPTRSRLGAGVYVPEVESDVVGRLEIALRMIPAIEAIETKVRGASKSGALAHMRPAQRVRAAHTQGILDAREVDAWQRYERLRRECIMVDDFPHEFGRHERVQDQRNDASDHNSGPAGRDDVPAHAGSEFERGEV
jgi:acyl-CoA dehydrogenase